MTLTSTIGNRYRIHEQLGAGGMGRVYRATDRITGQTIALKQVQTAPGQLEFASRDGLPDDASSVQFRLALANEFQTLAALRHPNIISVLNYGFDEQRQPYFTMDYVDGAQTLLDYAAHKSLAVKINLLVQVLQALDYLHRCGILHRDLKPGNVLVKAGQVKILDFGIAMLRDRSAPSSRLTGTLAYIAPELLQGQPPGEAADLYAVGVMAYQMFAGRHPFDTTSIHRLMHDIVNTVPNLALLTPDEMAAPPADDAPTHVTGTRPEEGQTLAFPGGGGTLVLDNKPTVGAAPPSRLAAVIGQLLAKKPEDRYLQAADAIRTLCDAVGMPAPQESAAVRESFLQAARFVGREDELARLKEALQAALDGRGEAWLVGGESGVGKSRLVDELRTWALVQGAAVFRGQGVSGGGLPYQLWREPLRLLLLSAAVDDLEAGTLKEIVPDIGGLLERDIPDAPLLEGRPRQQRLAQTIVEVFRRCGQPALLILEDLHWAAESLDVLRDLARAASGLPLLVVGTYREDERPGLPDELPAMPVMKLPRLKPAAIAELSAAMLGEAGRQPSVLDLLRRETEGNAFFLVEVVRALAEEAGALGAVGRMALPERVLAGGVLEVVRRRLSRVPEWARPRLKLAAIAGRQLDLALLESAAHDDPASHLTQDEWLAACANVAVLDFQDGGWRFAHDRLRETVLADLAADERPALHRRVAEALERVYPDDRARAGMLAEHWRAADNAEKEVSYARLAAEVYQESGAYREALALGERALALLPEDHPERAALLYLTGNNRRSLGDYERAKADYEASLSLARALNDPAATASALRGLGAIAFDRGSLPDARRYLTESLALYRANTLNSRGMAQILSNLGLLAFYDDDMEAARAYYEESLSLARAIGDSFNIANTLNNLGILVKNQRDFDAARACYAESLDIARITGSRWSIGNALNNLADLATVEGDYRTAQTYLAESLDIARATGNQWACALFLCNLAFTYVMEGQGDAALMCLREGLSIASQIGAVARVLHVLAVYAEHFARSGQPERAVPLAALVAAHPATESEVLNDTIRPLLERLEAAMPPADWQSARDVALDLDTTVVGLLAEKV